MSVKQSYYKIKLFNLIYQLVIYIAFLYIVHPNLLIVIGGVILGVVIGRIRWKFSQKINDSRNFIFFYIVSEIALLSLFGFFIYHLAMNSIDQFTLYLKWFGFGFSIWIGYISINFLNLYRYEKKHGHIEGSTYTTPHQSGIESMIDKTVIVVQTCQPKGKIKYNNTLWNAVSIDNQTIESGSQALIDHVEKLTVFIKPIE